jgi:conjugal transfer mating pair stabilization protein TraG
MAIRSFAMSLVWIQLWPPLYAILNYVATLASARNLEAAAKMGTVAQGLALETAASIYSGAVSDQAIAGYMVISIPIIATAIIKGGEVAFQAVTGVGAVQSAASSEAAATSKGSITQNAVSMDQQQLAPTRSSAFMSTTSDAYGTTIQGSGPDAGVFRYQANLSRLASTFTFTERQANALGETAREAETLARTEREAMQRSQATALTRALGIQDSYERSQQRSGATSTSDGGSTSTQFQTLNSVARDVNRRLGLSDDSTVGKSVAASASVGASIPLTQIGAQARAEGRQIDQQTLQSAYDFARKAAESAQLTEASALIKDFRSSEAYQWARGNRTTSTAGYDSSFREASERQTVQRQRLWSSARTCPHGAVHARVEQRDADRLHQLRGAASRRARAPARGRPDQAAARSDRDRLLLRPRRKLGNGLRPQRQSARSVAAATGSHGLARFIAAGAVRRQPARGGRHCTRPTDLGK